MQILIKTDKGVRPQFVGGGAHRTSRHAWLVFFLLFFW